ncbi:JMJD8 [Bugula neritina]|uniref:JMJD8 n=1 Tax=Bugula neritina TaxID=10212 RepID=A0A7J7JKB2_BUGNE|nr:JMJD8 [Bugula neritina]
MRYSCVYEIAFQLILCHLLASVAEHSLPTSKNTHSHWYIDELAEEGPCNIKTYKYTDLSQDEFLAVYAYQNPVIITYDEKWNQVFQRECSRESMMEKYGQKVIRLSSANTHSYIKRDVTLQYYVDEVLRPQDINTLGNVLAVTGAGTGVPFHWHGPGFGEVVYGRKRWFLFPPEKTPHFNPDKTTLHWLYNDYFHIPPSDKPLECTLKPGQVIYFPDRWWHATLNLDTSVFISTFLG